ncbi:hypothetical protein BQ8482_380049 [Mesorhizobium delmotii]|uniref:Uncharacterized protein n=1 Tax=Mesorhizobium delmotii TaxID=1631247 RepID=A0A2P9ART1_9HYPH|nr:hypothetical protein BQ8482_380049 [Mesorhizobium delmotii]
MLIHFPPDSDGATITCPKPTREISAHDPKRSSAVQAMNVSIEPIPDLPVHAQQRALRRYNASDFCYGAFLGHRWS